MDTKLANDLPEIGQQFWWYGSSRMIVTLTVLEIAAETIKFKWEFYRGLMGKEQFGEVTWNKSEWATASVMPYVKPLSAADLLPDEKLCRTCSGTYFEIERDFEVLPCIWCNKKPGVALKHE